MSNLFLTTHIGYATKGASDEPSSSGFLITRVPLAIRWDSVVAVGAIEDPTLCYDNEEVTEPISVVHTNMGAFHVCCAHGEVLRLWEAWESSIRPFKLPVN